MQRQYTGSAGRVTNCQVGVSLSVATRTEHVPVDFARWRAPPLIGLVLLGVVSPLLPVPEHAYQAASSVADLEGRRAALRRGRELFAALLESDPTQR